MVGLYKRKRGPVSMSSLSHVEIQEADTIDARLTL